jgi:Rod binding domain-containing protein
MPVFLSRVELLDVGDGDTRDLYNELHENMESQGFSRTIGASNNSVKQLPPGVYRLAAEATPQAVYQLADQAVKRTDKKAKIIVVRFDGWWGNLDGAT